MLTKVSYEKKIPVDWGFRKIYKHKVPIYERFIVDPPPPAFFLQYTRT